MALIFALREPIILLMFSLKSDVKKSLQGLISIVATLFSIHIPPYEMSEDNIK